jgi:hypothetical protein
MNIPIIWVILAVVALFLLLFLLRFYVRKNRQDLQNLKSELKDSGKG